MNSRDVILLAQGETLQNPSNSFAVWTTIPSRKHGSAYGETFMAERRATPEYCASEEHPHLIPRARKLPIKVQQEWT